MGSILVAMSGGVDSSVSAFLMKQQGFDVTGATFKLFESENSEKSIRDAKKVSEFIGINHLVFDLTKEFKNSVIDYFIGEYTSGRTPNPCVVCNKTIKFGKAIEKMESLGFDRIATGHYSFIEKFNGRYAVKKILHKKDQSYYFCMLNQMQLSKILTPVSKFSKDEIREIAKNNGISVWNKSDSQDICFINGSYRDFFKENGVKNNPGNFVDSSGKILGSHNGIFNYTVGQRRGLNVSTGERLYVNTIDVNSKNIILSKRFGATKIVLKDVNFVSFSEENAPKNVQICVRYNSVLIDGTLEIQENKTAILHLSKPSFNVCPGQFAVCYFDNYLVCGGAISKFSF